MNGNPILIKTLAGTVIGYADGKSLTELLNGPDQFINLTRTRVPEKVETTEQLAQAPEYGEVLVNKDTIVVAVEL